MTGWRGSAAAGRRPGGRGRRSGRRPRRRRSAIGEVAVEEGLGAGCDRLGGERGEADDVAADLIELFLERLATFVAGGSWKRSLDLRTGDDAEDHRRTFAGWKALPGTDGHCSLAVHLLLNVSALRTCLPGVISPPYAGIHALFTFAPPTGHRRVNPASYDPGRAETAHCFQFPTREDTPTMTRISPRARWTLVLLVVFGLVAAACSSDSKKSNSSGTSATTKASAKLAAATLNGSGLDVPAGLRRDGNPVRSSRCSRP